MIYYPNFPIENLEKISLHIDIPVYAMKLEYKYIHVAERHRSQSARHLTGYPLCQLVADFVSTDARKHGRQTLDAEHPLKNTGAVL